MWRRVTLTTVLLIIDRSEWNLILPRFLIVISIQYIYSLNLSNFRTIETLCGLKKRRKKKDRFVMIASVYIRFERFFLKAIHCTVGESRVEVDTRLNGRGETRF